MAQRRDQISTNGSQTTRRTSLGLLASVASGLLLSACSHVPVVNTLFGPTSEPTLSGNIGTIVSDEPQATLVGHDVLARRGNAVDAATATAIALGVTLPSRASLGGGGACLVAPPNGDVKSIVFLPQAGQTLRGDRPASTPAMLRGLYLMQHQYGSVDFGDLILPAQKLASNGMTVSRTLASDLSTVRIGLLADKNAQAIFGRDETGTVVAGDNLAQPRLASFLDRVHSAGVGDLYNGALATVYASASQQAGGGLTNQDLRNTLPLQTDALHSQTGRLTASFLAPPADGGLGAAMRYQNGSNAQGTVAAWRASKSSSLSEAQAILDSNKTSNARLPALPASTSFVVTDRNGMAVACTLSENNLFGTGRIAGSTGIVLGASPATTPQPLLAAAILHHNHALKAVIAASGQNDAADAVGDAAQAAAHNATIPHSGSGRVNVITCQGGTCHGDLDPRGTGLTVGSTER
ncbi:gamma-glutamyltransferase [Swingsia samuiensis]|uniref:gamma-glutamyltransferase n=1 Tax=Swingsia samuiensis TaxID=1293412 RepID=UPI001FE84524|nr:gamma-glutamyltransferase [Swingsia samuiensis]